MDKLPITLATFVKDDIDGLRNCLESVRGIVSEIVVVDTGSTDGTVSLAKKYTNLVYQVGFSDFGNIRTITAHLATQPWVLMLDSDETLVDSYPMLKKLIDQKPGVRGDNMELDEDGKVIIDSWALPRRRWRDEYMTEEVETEAWPDLQVRLFRNHPDKRIKFIRRIHETVEGCVRTEISMQGPIIEHFQGVNKSKERRSARVSQYRQLYEADLKDGVHHTEPAVARIDEQEQQV